MQETNLRRELAILTVLGGEDAIEDGGLGVVRIADLIGREKSQVSRTLKTLAESGFVDRDAATLQYRLGWRFFALAAGARREVKRAADDLSALLGWSSDPLREAGDTSGDGTVRRGKKREEGEMR